MRTYRLEWEVLAGVTGDRMFLCMANLEDSMLPNLRNFLRHVVSAFCASVYHL